MLPPEICFHATQCSSSTLCVESSIHGLNLDHDIANLSNENLQHSKESKSWPVQLRSFQDNISIYYRLFMMVSVIWKGVSCFPNTVSMLHYAV